MVFGVMLKNTKTNPLKTLHLLPGVNPTNLRHPPPPPQKNNLLFLLKKSPGTADKVYDR